jgi:hypothetical protein
MFTDLSKATTSYTALPDVPGLAVAISGSGQALGHDALSEPKSSRLPDVRCRVSVPVVARVSDAYGSYGGDSCGSLGCAAGSRQTKLDFDDAIAATRVDGLLRPTVTCDREPSTMPLPGTGERSERRPTAATAPSRQYRGDCGDRQSPQWQKECAGHEGILDARRSCLPGDKVRNRWRTPRHAS